VTPSLQTYASTACNTGSSPNDGETRWIRQVTIEREEWGAVRLVGAHTFTEQVWRSRRCRQSEAYRSFDQLADLNATLAQRVKKAGADRILERVPGPVVGRRSQRLWRTGQPGMDQTLGWSEAELLNAPRNGWDPTTTGIRREDQGARAANHPSGSRAACATRRDAPLAS